MKSQEIEPLPEIACPKNQLTDSGQNVSDRPRTMTDPFGRGPVFLRDRMSEPPMSMAALIQSPTGSLDILVWLDIYWPLHTYLRVNWFLSKLCLPVKFRLLLIKTPLLAVLFRIVKKPKIGILHSPNLVPPGFEDDTMEPLALGPSEQADPPSAVFRNLLSKVPNARGSAVPLCGGVPELAAMRHRAARAHLNSVHNSDRGASADDYDNEMTRERAFIAGENRYAVPKLGSLSMHASPMPSGHSSMHASPMLSPKITVTGAAGALAKKLCQGGSAASHSSQAAAKGIVRLQREAAAGVKSSESLSASPVRGGTAAKDFLKTSGSCYGEREMSLGTAKAFPHRGSSYVSGADGGSSLYNPPTRGVVSTVSARDAREARDAYYQAMYGVTSHSAAATPLRSSKNSVSSPLQKPSRDCPLSPDLVHAQVNDPHGVYGSARPGLAAEMHHLTMSCPYGPHTPPDVQMVKRQHLAAHGANKEYAKAYGGMAGTLTPLVLPGREHNNTLLRHLMREDGCSSSRADSFCGGAGLGPSAGLAGKMTRASVPTFDLGPNLDCAGASHMSSRIHSRLGSPVSQAARRPDSARGDGGSSEMLEGSKCAKDFFQSPAGATTSTSAGTGSGGRGLGGSASKGNSGAFSPSSGPKPEVGSLYKQMMSGSTANNSKASPQRSARIAATPEEEEKKIRPGSGRCATSNTSGSSDKKSRVTGEGVSTAPGSTVASPETGSVEAQSPLLEASGPASAASSAEISAETTPPCPESGAVKKEKSNVRIRMTAEVADLAGFDGAQASRGKSATKSVVDENQLPLRDGVSSVDTAFTANSGEESKEGAERVVSVGAVSGISKTTGGQKTKRGSMQSAASGRVSNQAPPPPPPLNGATLPSAAAPPGTDLSSMLMGANTPGALTGLVQPPLGFQTPGGLFGNIGTLGTLPNVDVFGASVTSPTNLLGGGAFSECSPFSAMNSPFPSGAGNFFNSQTLGGKGAGGPQIATASSSGSAVSGEVNRTSSASSASSVALTDSKGLSGGRPGNNGGNNNAQGNVAQGNTGNNANNASASGMNGGAPNFNPMASLDPNMMDPNAMFTAMYTGGFGDLSLPNFGAGMDMSSFGWSPMGAASAAGPMGQYYYDQTSGQMVMGPADMSGNGNNGAGGQNGMGAAGPNFGMGTPMGMNGTPMGGNNASGAGQNAGPFGHMGPIGTLGTMGGNAPPPPPPNGSSAAAAMNTAMIGGPPPMPPPKTGADFGPQFVPGSTPHPKGGNKSAQKAKQRSTTPGHNEDRDALSPASPANTTNIFGGFPNGAGPNSVGPVGNQGGPNSAMGMAGGAPPFQGSPPNNAQPPRQYTQAQNNLYTNGANGVAMQSHHPGRNMHSGGSHHRNHHSRNHGSGGPNAEASPTSSEGSQSRGGSLFSKGTSVPGGKAQGRALLSMLQPANSTGTPGQNNNRNVRVTTLQPPEASVELAVPGQSEAGTLEGQKSWATANSGNAKTSTSGCPTASPLGSGPVGPVDDWWGGAGPVAGGPGGPGGPGGAHNNNNTRGGPMGANRGAVNKGIGKDANGVLLGSQKNHPGNPSKVGDGSNRGGMVGGNNVGGNRAGPAPMLHHKVRILKLVICEIPPLRKYLGRGVLLI